MSKIEKLFIDESREGLLEVVAYRQELKALNEFLPFDKSNDTRNEIRAIEKNVDLIVKTFNKEQIAALKEEGIL